MGRYWRLANAHTCLPVRRGPTCACGPLGGGNLWSCGIFLVICGSGCPLGMGRASPCALGKICLCRCKSPSMLCHCVTFQINFMGFYLCSIKALGTSSFLSPCVPSDRVYGLYRFLHLYSFKWKLVFLTCHCFWPLVVLPYFFVLNDVYNFFLFFFQLQFSVTFSRSLV